MHEAFDSESNNQAEERLEVELAVKQGLISVEQAEIWASGNNRLPFYIAGIRDPDELSIPMWSLSLSVIWITWRDLGEVERHNASHRFWKEYFWRQPPVSGQICSLEQAETSLRESLLCGKLNAFGNIAWNNSYGERGPRVQIKREEWTSLQWTESPDSVVVDFLDQKPFYLDVFLFKDEVIAKWPARKIEVDNSERRVLFDTNKSSLRGAGRPNGTGLDLVDIPKAKEALALFTAGKTSSITKAVESVLGSGASESHIKRVQRKASALQRDDKGR